MILPMDSEASGAGELSPLVIKHGNGPYKITVNGCFPIAMVDYWRATFKIASHEWFQKSDCHVLQ